MSELQRNMCLVKTVLPMMYEESLGPNPKFNTEAVLEEISHRWHAIWNHYRELYGQPPPEAP